MTLVGPDRLTDDLTDRLEILRLRVVGAVARFREVDPEPDDVWRGAFISDDKIDRSLSIPGDARLRAFTAGPDSVGPSPTSTLGRLMATAGLTPFDVDVLVAAAAPDLDERFEHWYGYLHDDLRQRHLTIGLALSLAGHRLTDIEAGRMLSPSWPLSRTGLVVVDDADRPVPTRSMRVADRVLRHLLGADEPDSLVTSMTRATSELLLPEAGILARAIDHGDALVSVGHASVDIAVGVVVAAAAMSGRPAVVVEPELAGPVPVEALIDAIVVEATCLGAVLVVVGGTPAVVSGVARRCSGSVVSIGARTSVHSSMRPTVTVEITSSIDQRVLWESALVSGGQDVELADGMVAFGAGPSEAERVVRSALVDASIHGRATVTLDELRAAARRTNAPGLEQLSTRIVPAIGWDDVVLPDESLAELRRLSDRIRFAPVVYDGWGLRRGGGRGEGTVALFAGESGTGKTHAAEAVAAELGLELHTIDLSTVVDKYIGETEKNLERVFRAAEGVNTVLFFDEADALFGKRSEVSDARDRYANIEVSYLLQRLERFRGLAILATNLRGNLDDAFARRLTSVIDFPPPDAAMRARLWRLMLRNVPLEGGLDITALAERFELTGGGIRNAVVEAAFRAASAGRNVGERELIDAIAAEYQKVGRLWSGDL